MFSGTSMLSAFPISICSIHLKCVFRNLLLAENTLYHMSTHVQLCEAVFSISLRHKGQQINPTKNYLQLVRIS